MHGDTPKHILREPVRLPGQTSGYSDHNEGRGYVAIRSLGAGAFCPIHCYLSGILPDLAQTETNFLLEENDFLDT